MSYIIDSQKSDVKKLYNQVDKNKEFEFAIFSNNNFSISYQEYLTCLEFISKRAKFQKLKVETINTLDIAYLDRATSTSYRITLTGIDIINKYMKMLYDWKNHVIYKVLITKFLEGSKDITIIEKVKEAENVIDLTDYSVRIRLSEENDIDKAKLEKLKSLKYTDIPDITFRLKERVSLYIEETKDKTIKVDLTKTNTTKSISRIENVAPNYELEIEYMNNSKPKSDNDLDTILKEVEIFFKIIQQSNFVISKIDVQKVLKEYARILSLDYDKIRKLDGRKPESLEIQYVTEMLPNRYAVTDKADGERNFLIIVDNSVYLINTGLHVKDTGIRLDKKLSKYNGSIMDGENIFLPKENRHMMMIFDCLFNGEKDVRKNANFMERIKEADDIIENCFILNKQMGFTYKDYDSKNKAFDLEDIGKFHETEIKKFMDNLNNDIQIEKKFPLIRRKYFIGANGAKPWEIFKYSEIIWQKYTEDSSVKCPYLLDGLIYQPLTQVYTTNTKENKFVEYKWKPPTKNSIDFYITFEKDPKTGKPLTVYDNSNYDETIEDYVKNKPYRIINLHVGKALNKQIGQEPILFREEEDGYQAYIYLTDGEVRDSEGKIISDKTVVEFFYNDDAAVDIRFRWNPIRTRYDKTESVMKYRVEYGNYYTTANSVWRSMINPVLMSDMMDLAKGNNESKNEYFYDKKIESIRSKIGKELIIIANKETAYYTVSNDIYTKSWRAFHNWIKSLIIYTHCNYLYQDERKLSVLDIGCGTGGDIKKYYYGNIAFLVAFDPDKHNLLNSFNGAVSRYNNFKKEKPRFPRMEFFQGDGGSLLNYEDQYRALGGLSFEDRQTIEKHFSKDPSKRTLFDRLSCQFAMHYMFKTRETLDNFKQNINDYLKPGGYFIATCFDAQQVVKLFGDTDKFSSYYTDQKGEKKLLWQIVRKYDKPEKDTMFTTGYAIDFFGSWMFQEGQFETEYLVDKRFIEKEFLDDCDLELVDSDMFDNQYKMHKDFIVDYAKYESVDETRKFMMSVKDFYDAEDSDITKGLLANDSITRYYVFRKKDNFDNSKKVASKQARMKVNKKTKKIKKMKGGNPESNSESNSESNPESNFDESENIELLDFANDTKYYLPDIESNEYSLFNSIHEVLQTHKIIPKGETFKNLFKSLEIPIPRKNSKVLYDNKALHELGKKIVIEHELDGGNKKKIIDGLSIITVEKTSSGLKVDKPKKLNKANIALLKEGNMYRPIYTIDKEFNKKALFKQNEELIEKLFNL